MTRSLRCACVLLVATLVSAPTDAAWILDGNIVASTPENQDQAVAVSDGAGGAIVAWRDARNGNNDIYAQRLDADGNALWTNGGVAICTATNSQDVPAITMDGAGGAIIAWEDSRNGIDLDVWAQRVDASGNVQWAANGVAVVTASWSQSDIQILADGAGGAFLAWWDQRNTPSGWDIFAQRVNASGTTQWITNGVFVLGPGSSGQQPDIVSDGAGGLIVAAADGSGNLDVYAQRVDASGALQWGGGVQITNVT